MESMLFLHLFTVIQMRIVQRQSVPALYVRGLHDFCRPSKITTYIPGATFDAGRRHREVICSNVDVASFATPQYDVLGIDVCLTPGRPPRTSLVKFARSPCPDLLLLCFF